MAKKFDVTIIGSGFAGSILAWVLASQGRRVLMIDKAIHPRFAIGESSTPIADLLLRRLGETYRLPELVALSTYGTWQTQHADLACGRKRGFSYFLHGESGEFCDGENHERSLLVAASATDEKADTHWFRSDVDHFLFQKAEQAGCETRSGNEVTDISLGTPNSLTLQTGESICTDWIVDASGRGGVLATMLGCKSLVDQMQTNTSSVFGHFQGVRSWSEHCQTVAVNARNDPFNADEAAQHHLFPNGWLWMLRFNNRITSVGWTTAKSSSSTPFFLGGDAESEFMSLQHVFRNSEMVHGPVRSGRLQRLFEPVVGDRCVMLPTTACTIDPLHSTGIAHSIGGIHRVASVILGSSLDHGSELQSFGATVRAEAKLLDTLVHTAYRTMGDFQRFTTACMLYFCAAIACEESVQAGSVPNGLWNVCDQRFVQVVDESCAKLCDFSRTTDLINREIREAIAPWNTAGLMNDKAKNRYAYTATK